MGGCSIQREQLVTLHHVTRAAIILPVAVQYKGPEVYGIKSISGATESDEDVRQRVTQIESVPTPGAD